MQTDFCCTSFLHVLNTSYMLLHIPQVIHSYALIYLHEWTTLFPSNTHPTINISISGINVDVLDYVESLSSRLLFHI